MVQVFTEENFEQEVIKAEGLVLVDFWASWCGPCRMVSPIMEELAQEYEGKVKIGKLNVDEQGSKALEYSIMSIPTVLFFKDGAVVEKVIGARFFDDYCDLIDKNL